MACRRAGAALARAGLVHRHGLVARGSAAPRRLWSAAAPGHGEGGSEVGDGVTKTRPLDAANTAGAKKKAGVQQKAQDVPPAAESKAGEGAPAKEAAGKHRKGGKPEGAAKGGKEGGRTRNKKSATVTIRLDKGPGRGLFPVLPEKVAKAGPSAASATSFPELASINNDQAAFTAGLDSPSGNLGQRMDAHRDFSAQMETLKDDAPWKGYMAGLLATHLARNPKMSPDSKAEMMATMASKLKTINPK